MAAAARSEGSLTRFTGRTEDNLTYKERLELVGKWVAVELYSELTLPLRVFAAVGDSAASCRAQLRSSGLDATKFEYFPLKGLF